MNKPEWKKWTNNVGVKVISVFAAIMVWLIVVNIDDPQITRSFTAQAQMKNEATINGAGKVYEIEDGTDQITFKVTGPRSKVEDLDASDFEVTADMDNIELLELVPVEVTALRYKSNLIIDIVTTNVKVSIEDKASQQFVITATSAGTPKNGYAIGTIEVNPNVITISGPESVVSTISKVTATINVEGMSTNLSDSVIPVVYNEDGEVIDTTHLTFNKKNVSIKASILETKTVPVKIELSGSVADGYELGEYECVPGTIEIKGKSSDLDEIEEIVIDDDVVSIAGAVKNIEQSVDITEYLPEGIELVDSDMAMVAVTVAVNKIMSKAVEIQTTDINVKNLEENYTLTYDTPTITATLLGIDEAVSDIEVSDLKPVIDLDGYSPGTHTVTVSLSLSDDVTLESQVTVKITIVDSTVLDVTGGTANDTDTGNEGEASQDGSSEEQ